MWNGSFVIPLQYANKDVVGVEYIISFGVGVITITLLVLGIYCGILICSVSMHQCTWGCHLGGHQCRLVVSAMWADFYCKEVTNKKAVTVLLGSSMLVVGGAAMLSKFGTYR